MFYENLPGINVTLRDGGLVIPEQGGSESMLIIAPSLMADAPEDPVLVRTSSELVEYGFGDFYVNGEVNPIAVEWKAAVDAGCRVVYLVALKEVEATRASELEQAAIDEEVAKGKTLVEAQAQFQGVLTGTDAAAAKRRKFVYYYDLLMGTLMDFAVQHVVVKGVTLEDQVDSLSAAFFKEIQNGEDFPHIGGIVITSYQLESKVITFPLNVTASNNTIALKVDGTTQTVTLPAKNYDGSTHTLGTLASDLQTALRNHTTPINVAVRENMGKILFLFEKEVSVESGTTMSALGLNGETKLVKTPFGLVVKGSFAQTLADYCAVKTLMQNDSVGYIGVKTPLDTKVSTIRAHVATLETLDTEISPYLQVIASESGVIIPVSNTTYYTNGATHYAALVSTLRKESAPTNKPVKGVASLRFDFSLRQLSQLTKKKLVTFRIKNGNQIVVTDGITTAPTIVVAGKARESDYSRLSTLRISQLAVQVVREAVDPFIGQPNEMPQYNALNTSIKSALEKIREAGAIQGYRFSIVNVSGRLDQATVQLEIIPAFEMRKVNVEVSLAPPNFLTALSQAVES